MQSESNKELELAWEYVTRTSMNIFLTGKAGTGKTTFLKRVVNECPKRKIVLAPTGVAAINAGGMTLHSFFQLPFGLFLPEFEHVQAHDKEGRYKFHRKKLKLIRSIDLMIIDEVSMLRADIVDELDALLRRLRHSEKPFGGVQVLMIGDVQQLSPVVRDEEWQMMSRYYESPYFFDAKVLHNNAYRLVELDRIYRQSDSEFIGILAAVRENRMTPSLLAKLNARYIPDYEAPEGCITLCTHNFSAREINERKLAELKSPEYSFQATIEGNFPESMYPQDETLILKRGAQVMFTKNDPNPEKRYVNGTLGKVSDIGSNYIKVRLEDGEEVEVEPLPWENLKYDINEETKEIVSAIDGLFTQYPLKTAWAITIHKSQGLTFDHAVIDAGRSFSHGQVYVALSRCRTLEGIVLKQKISDRSIIDDRRVDLYADYVSQSLPSEEILRNDRRAYFREVIKDLFDFGTLEKYYFAYLKFVRFTFPGLFPNALSLWKAAEAPFRNELAEVGHRFTASLDRIVQDDYLTSEYLQERVCKASNYFLSKAEDVLLPLVKIAESVDFDDKNKKKINRQYFSNFSETLFLKLFLWNHTLKGFDLDKHLVERSILSAEIPEATPSRLITLFNKAIGRPGVAFSVLSKETPQVAEAQEQEEVTNHDLFALLREWRKDKAEETELPAYCIMHQKTMISIANTVPTTPSELLAIKGVGKAFISKYGDEILALIKGEQELF